MNTKLLPVDQITVLPSVRRPPAKVSDDLLRKSIERGGIQQPLIIVPDGERYLLAKGLSRLRAAKALGMDKVPVVLDEAPAGVSPEKHVTHVRFVLVHHRQDLLPSQKGELVWSLKARFGMSNAQVAAYLGIAADSVTNWLAVRQYIPPVVKAMDAGQLSMNAARVFDGMTEEGQRTVWREKAAALTSMPADMLHREVRMQYPPGLFPAFYRQPELVIDRLARKSGKRRSKPRGVSSGEKKLLATRLDIQETELRANQDELRRYEAEINAAIAPIGAILRNPSLLAMVPKDTREELERFGEVYV